MQKRNWYEELLKDFNRFVAPAPGSSILYIPSRREFATVEFGNGEYEYLGAALILFAAPDPQEELMRLSQAVGPGGVLATLEPSLEMRPERVLAYAIKNSITGSDFNEWQDWSKDVQENNRFSLADLKRLHEKAGLDLLGAEEEADRMLIAVKSRRPDSL